MKEHKDDVVSSVKESTEAVDSSKPVEIGTERGKIERIFGDKDGEDTVVDVVSADMVVDEHGGAKVDLGLDCVTEEGSVKETGARDHVMEDAGVGEEGKNDVVESRVETLEKVEVVKEVIQENVVTSGSGKSGNGPVIGDAKTASETSSKELADGDHVMDEKTQNETEVLNSSKIAESTEGQVVGKDESEDGGKNQSSSSEVVNAGSGEDNVHVSSKNTENDAGVDQTKKESVQSTIEATTDDTQKSGNGTQAGDSKTVVELDGGVTVETVERLTESVQEAADLDCVMNEKTEKDEILDSTKIPDSMEQPTEFVQEASDGDSVMSEKTEKDEILDSTKIPDSMEQPTECVQEAADGDSVMSEKTVKDEILDSTKNPDLVTKVDEVIAKEGITGKDEKSLDGVSESSLVSDKHSLSSEHVNTDTCESDAVHESPQNLDQDAKVDQMNETIDVGTYDASKSGKEAELGDSKMDSEPETAKVEIDVIQKGEETELGFTKEASEQPVNSVQEVADGNQDSSKIQQSSIMASLGLEEDDVVVVDEGLEGKNEAQDRVSVESNVVNPDNNQSTLTEAVNVGTGEVDSTNKEESSFATIKPVEVTEPEPATDKVAPGTANEVVEIETGLQTVKVEPVTIGQDSSEFQADQGSNVSHSNQGNEMTSHIPDSTVEVPTTGGQHDVIPANSEFSYEDAHMERGEDAGMDIDEVLGWKDETPSVQEDNQKADPTNLSLQQPCYFHPPENEGIKQEASRRHGVDKSASVNSFGPDMLVDYVRSLAKFPYNAGDNMELTMAKAQLSSYGRFKGHRQLAEFQVCGDLLEEVEQVIKEEPHSEDGSKKRKALDSISDGSEKRPTLQTETVTGNSSFKVGEHVQKVASQLTGPPEQVTVQSLGPTQLGNQADMLSQLHLAAQDPMKGIIQNNLEENLLQENQNGGGGHQIVAFEPEKQHVKPTRRSNKKRFFSSNHEIEAKEQSELIERRRKNLATEVLMKFTEGIYFPSEIHLNKMFRRFGPLMESETEVDRQSGRARVVFKKCSDAEVAHSSAGKFNIFGSINVNYELNYTPLISYKPLPPPLAQDPAHAC